MGSKVTSSVLPAVAAIVMAGLPREDAGASATERLTSADLRDERFSSSTTCAGDAASEEYCEVVLVGSSDRWRCTGVVVGLGWVLTAAHCLPATRVGWGHATDRLATTGAVTGARRAPGGLDAVLLKVSGGAWGATASLAAVTDGTTELHAVGFGSPRSESGSAAKELVRLRLATTSGCDPLERDVLGCAPGRELVAASPAHKDTCNGDSGGPLYQGGGEARSVVGLVSRPIRGARAACGEGGIYLRTDVLLPWISSIIEEEP